jgi:CRISPR/Cas system CMR-associated protein Cmr1 (group 7 of RAMP superfamily)
MKIEMSWQFFRKILQYKIWSKLVYPFWSYFMRTNRQRNTWMEEAILITVSQGCEGDLKGRNDEKMWNKLMTNARH